MNVLIVDDSKAMQNIITKSMKSVGYLQDSYAYANDGEEALQKIRNSIPDLVLCDMHMPKMTGLELLKTLRNEKIPTPMVIVSIDDDPATMANVKAMGGNAYLKKPFTSEQLFNTVTGILGKTLKASAPELDVRKLIPSKQVIERVLSSLAASDVHFVDARFDDINFDHAPFYGCTFQNENGRLMLGVFMDVFAANTLAAIIERKPMTTALEAARNGQIDNDAKIALLAAQGVFSALCKPTPSGQLLEVHAEHIATNGHAHLSKHLRQYANSSAIFSIDCGVCRGGKVVMLSPETR